MDKIKVLILCTGNSCRSQMAHGWLESFDAENKKLFVASAGTHPAARVNPKAAEVMLEEGIHIAQRAPQNVSKYLNEPWDYVITVCGGANESCPMFTGKVKHRLHIGFEDPSEAVGDASFVNAEFKRVRDEIKARFKDFYTEILNG